jgi:hypothetical protein
MPLRHMFQCDVNKVTYSLLVRFLFWRSEGPFGRLLYQMTTDERRYELFPAAEHRFATYAYHLSAQSAGGEFLFAALVEGALLLRLLVRLL